MAQKEFRNFVLQRLENLNLSKLALAQRTGLARSAVYKLLEGEVREARVSTLIRLARVLQTDFTTLAALVSTSNRSTSDSHHRKDNGAVGSWVPGITKLASVKAVQGGERFHHSWIFCNTEQKHWKDRRLSSLHSIIGTATQEIGTDILWLHNGLNPENHSIRMPDCSPGEFVELQMNFTAPSGPGTYFSYWKITDQRSRFCFSGIFDASLTVIVVDRPKIGDSPGNM